MYSWIRDLLSHKNYFLERSVILAIVSGLLIFIILRIFSNQSINQLLVDEEEALEAIQITYLMQHLDRDLVTVESNVRSYLLFSDTSYLTTSIDNMNKAMVYVDSMRIFMTVDNSHVSDYEKLRRLVDEKVAFDTQILNLSTKGHKQEAIDSLKTNRGINLRKEILNVLGQYERERNEQFSMRIKANKLYAYRLNRADIIGTVLGIIIILAALYFLVRGVHKRILLFHELENARVLAERSALAQEQFMANMSHEIRTPLNAILGFTNLLQRTNLNAKQTEFVKSISQSGENLLVIVNDVLDFSKIEAGLMHIEEIPFSIKALAHSVEQMFRPKVKEKALSLIIDIPAEVPDMLLGDPTRLTQILLNLLGNAIKFTQQGEISLKVRNQSHHGNALHLNFEVIDTGIGIPSDKIESIFDRFNQADTETTRRFGGTGLGLAIVRQLIALMGGNISVESTVGQGTNFKFWLPFVIADPHLNPLVIPEEKTSDDPLTSPVSASRLPLLIVEDNPMNGRITALQLEDWGFEFDMAENGRQAIEALRQKQYGLILMDIQMPVMDGFAATQYIRQNINPAVPIIAMTAHVLAGEREKCLSYGMNDYISKPIHAPLLRSMLEKYSLMPPREHPIRIDFNYLMEVARGKKKHLREMAQIFISQAPKEMKGVIQAIDSADYAKAGKIAHSMKSTLGYMGLNAFFQPLLQQIEEITVVTPPDLQALHHAIRQLNALVEEALRQVKEEILPMAAEEKTNKH